MASCFFVCRFDGRGEPCVQWTICLRIVIFKHCPQVASNACNQFCLIALGSFVPDVLLEILPEIAIGQLVG